MVFTPRIIRKAVSINFIISFILVISLFTHTLNQPPLGGNTVTTVWFFITN
jgi:hypothetical protein